MDTADLIKYYKRPCFIFNDSAPVKIDDDEIIDLDSISLDSNEDTWLLSNSKDNSYKELSKEEMKTRLDSVSMDGSGDFSRISLSNWDFNEETLNGSFFSPMNNANNYQKKLEFDVVDRSLDKPSSVESTIVQNKMENFRKPNMPLNECDTFKKPFPKNQASERKDDMEMSSGHVIGHEKNHAELNGTAKRKTVLNKSIPISHSTPLPMLRRRLRRSNDQVENDTSPVTSSSTSSAENIHIAVESEPITKFSIEDDSTTLEILDATLKDNNASPMLEIHDDSKSTSSSDSRRSSSSSIPKTVIQSPSNTFSRSSPSSRLNLGGNRNIFSPPKANNVKKTLFNENKIKEPARRTPSLSRLQAPSVNIDEEFVSVVEIKSKIGEKKPTSAPTSHIPRPSTRIPVFRTSNSCTRASKK